jgi:hypothetical protein
LGTCYLSGIGVERNHEEAVKWYHKAALLGYAPSQYNLGVRYFEGKGVPKDYTKAVYWYRKAAEQGYAIAQYNLGKRYELGQGVSQDCQTTLKWYRITVIIEHTDQLSRDARRYARRGIIRVERKIRNGKC